MYPQHFMIFFTSLTSGRRCEIPQILKNTPTVQSLLETNLKCFHILSHFAQGEGQTTSLICASSCFLYLRHWGFWCVASPVYPSQKNKQKNIIRLKFSKRQQKRIVTCMLSGCGSYEDLGWWCGMTWYADDSLIRCRWVEWMIIVRPIQSWARTYFFCI